MKIKRIKNIIAAFGLAAATSFGVASPVVINNTAVTYAATTGITPEEAIAKYGKCNLIIKLKIESGDKNKVFPFTLGQTYHPRKMLVDDEENGLLDGRYGDLVFIGNKITKTTWGETGIYGYNKAVFYLKDGEQVKATDLPIAGSYIISDPDENDLSLDDLKKYDTSDYEFSYEQEGLKGINQTPSAFAQLKNGGTYTMVVTAKKKVTPVPVTGIKLDKTNIVVENGKRAQITATITPENATNKGIEWTSSNTNAVLVNGIGTVMAAGSGTATITATTRDGNKVATCKVTVPQETPSTVSVTGVSLNKTNTELKKDSSTTLTATVSPENATNKAVTWTSSDTKVATVKNGTVKAVGSGTATITATTRDGNKVATCKVTVPQETPSTVSVTGVSLNKTNTELKKDSSTTLTATVSPENATNKAVTWTSSNTKVAMVKNGTVKAVGSGTATITVKTVDGSKTATCKITVPAENNNGNNGKTNKTGWYRENGAWHYYKNNSAYTGWHWMTSKEGEKIPHWSYFDNSGNLYTGWHLMSSKEGEKTPHYSYFGDNGWLRTGWFNLEGKWRYCDASGWAYTGWHLMSSKEGERTPHWSYFDSAGKLYTGWQLMGSDEGEKTPHYSYFGDNGWLQTGWIKYDGKWSYCDALGWAYTGWHWMTNKEGENISHWSYFDKTGKLYTGMHLMGSAEGELTPHYSYFGDNGWLVTSNMIIDGVVRKFDSRGWLIE